MILPQFGSEPATAVLMRGELPTAIATFFAEEILEAFLTLISINLVAPSPSLTICIAKSFITSSNASLNLISLLSPILFIDFASLLFIAWPVAKAKTVSFVEVSLSTLIELKLFLTPRFKSV